MAPVVCVASFRVFLRSSPDLLRFRLLTPAVSRSFLNAESTTDYRGRARYCCIHSSSRQLSSTPSKAPPSPPTPPKPPTQPKPPPPPPPAQGEDSKDEVTVKYIQGLPHITVPLPSRSEKCRFALKPVSHKVFNLIEMLKLEDRGIDRAIILNEEGVRIASSCSIESLMDEPFWLYINDKQYKVVPPMRDRFKSEDLSKLGDIRALVSQLYEALHVGEYQIQKEEELVTQLEKLKYDLGPLESTIEEMGVEAKRKSTLYAWAGLGFMSIQFGILARLTWWEYSWDIMEPVTYFVTYGTSMAGYAYWLATRMEYGYADVKDRHYLISIHNRARKKNFNLEEYNTIKRQIYDIEYDLRRLRDPLNLQIAPHLDRAAHRRMPLAGSGTPAVGPTKDPCAGGSDSSSPVMKTYRYIVCSLKKRTLIDTIKAILSQRKK